MRSCETTSGGVKMALMIKIKTIAYLRFCLKNSGEAIPILDKKTTMSGSSKTTPKDKTKVPMKERYRLAEIMGTIKSEPKLKRNFKETGTITQYPNTAPSKNRIRESGANQTTYFL